MAKLYLSVITREGVQFDGEVESITSYNDSGRFDVLRDHAQFISIIKDKVVVRQIDGATKEFPVENAIMRVKGTQVEVFLGIKQ